MIAFRTLGRACLAAGLLAGMSLAAAQARTLEVGADKEYKLPSAAAVAAREGDKVLIQPGEYFDCATWRANKLVIEGVGDPAGVVITDKVCNGKGLFITAGNGTTIRNMTLTRARVPDGNGAGIRNEGADLTVENVRFINNQNGILSTPDTPGAIVIKDSVFDRNGGCANSGGCAHGIYIGNALSLHIERSQFLGTKQGHHIKSRAARTEVIGCTIQDGPEGTASYLIEVPIGGTVIVRDSTMQKGPEAENHGAAIVIGAEGVSQPTREITIENNSFRNDGGGWTTIFVRNLTATDATLRNNRLAGQVRPLEGDGKVTPAR